MADFSTSALFRCSVTGLRDFLGRPLNLPRVSNPDLELQIVTAPEVVVVGEKVEFTISAYGFKQRATNQYTDVSEILIAESQIDGPMRAWRHVQRFELQSDGMVRLTDEVSFEPPGGMLGYLLTEARVRESLEEGMTFRYETLQEIIDAGEIL
ncbi:MAG: hypothetical protein ACK58L_06425 [Planctomycetota bacterium]